MTIMTQEEEKDREDFEFQVVLMQEEEREFNRQKMRETGYLRMGVLV